MGQNAKAYLMLVCATLFWAGNFTIAKFAYLQNIPPNTLSFLRWCLVWIILFPFTYQEIFKLKYKIKEHVKQNLAAHEYPRLIEFVEELPLTTTGKIKRNLIRKNHIEVKNERKI